MADITIVIPTFNEAKNVPELLTRLDACFAPGIAEVLFVDDSTDNTPLVIQDQAARQQIPVRLFHRRGAARVGGLSGAVVEGIRHARTPRVLVMDGDLQHPPEVAVRLLEEMDTADADIVVASRYVDGGDAGGLSSSKRRAVSRGSTLLAGMLFPRRVGRTCTDPMTGFFCVRKEALDIESLRPRGFKILLEILARHPLRVAEIPFTLGDRAHGVSKADWRNGVAFLVQILSLRIGRSGGFALVGLVGLVANLLIMAGFLKAGIPALGAAIGATEITIVGNFLLQERLVFDGLGKGRSRTVRLFQTFLYNNVDVAARTPVLAFLVVHGILGPIAAQAVTIAVSFGARLTFTQRVVYRPPAQAAVLPEPPTDAEVDAYLERPQHRWIFWVQAGAFGGVAVSMWGLSNNNYWTLAFLAPLLVMVVEQALALRTSTFRRTVTATSHRELVNSYTPHRYPSIDVFLPTAGEPVAMLENTYRHVARLQWPGTVTAFVLDDAGRAEVASLADRYGFRYVARGEGGYKKAGNLQHALNRTSGGHVTILDADFTPRPDYLLQLMPYMEDPGIGIVQSPQYFATDRSMSWLERCAGATQEMFYRFIQPSRDAVGAAICVGTSAIYRREALTAIGGFPLIGHSEDVYTGVRMGRVGYRVKYVPALLTRGKSPDDVDSFINQQYRWCEGSMSLMTEAEFHDDITLSLDRRLSFWSGFVYYLTTAMNAVLAPLAVLVMVWFFADRVASANMLPLLGALLVWLTVFPMINYGRWRFDVLRVQTIYGFAHLFCIMDLARGKVSEWVATNAAQKSARSAGSDTHVDGRPRSPGRRPAGRTSKRPLAQRVRLTVGIYLTVTQAAILIGLIRGAWTYGLHAYWANLVLAVVNAYVFIPVAALCLSTLAAKRRPARAAAHVTAQVGDLRDAVSGSRLPHGISPAPALLAHWSGGGVIDLVAAEGPTSAPNEG